MGFIVPHRSRRKLSGFTNDKVLVENGFIVPLTKGDSREAAGGQGLSHFYHGLLDLLQSSWRERVPGGRCGAYCCGAAVFDVPANNRRPSPKVILDTLAVGDPFRACQPSTLRTAPAGRSSFLHPRRYNAFAPPVSKAQFTTFPSAPTTSM